MPRPFRGSELARAGLAAGLLLLAFVPATLGHDGGPRLILEPSQVSPGGVVVVRGEDLGADDEMRLALVGGSSRTELATIVSDSQGHFTIAVQISGDAPAGTYEIEAGNQSGPDLTAAMSIAGAPLMDDGAGAPPGQDEGLPAIVLSAGPASAPGPIAAPQPIAIAASTATSDIDLGPFVALAWAIGALGTLFWRTRRLAAAPTRSADLS